MSRAIRLHILRGQAATALAAVVLWAAFASAAHASDAHLAAGTPTLLPALSYAGGIASAPWPDPLCPPSQGTENTDPGQAPNSWTIFLINALTPSNYDDYEGDLHTAVDGFVQSAWDGYVQQAKQDPPDFATVQSAKDGVVSQIRSTLTDPNTWLGIVDHIAGVAKPTAANSLEFLGQLTQYLSGVTSAACDGNDAYRLYQAINNPTSLWQLGPDGTWAQLTYNGGAPQPSATAQFTPVPGLSRTYLVSTPTGNPRGVTGLPLYRVQGELTMNPVPNFGPCESGSPTTEQVGQQLNLDIYNNVVNLASSKFLSAIPEAAFLSALPQFHDDCAYTPAAYTQWTNGPLVDASFVLSDQAQYLAGYTVAANGTATLDRWQRNASAWSAGVAFASPTFNQAGDDVPPRLAISGDGQTLAGCYLSGPLDGTGLDSLAAQESQGIPPRYPEVFNFRTAAVDYPSTGATDPQSCSHVTLDHSGDTVWYLQNRVGWFSSSTALAIPKPILSLPPTVQATATGPAGAAVTFAASATDALGAPLPVTCSPPSGSDFPIGSTTVTCSSTGPSGTSTGSFEIHVAAGGPPTVACASAPTAWQAGNVAIACTASDSASGLADPSQASFVLSTSVAAGAESADASTNSLSVCNNAGECNAAGPITGLKVDRRPPQVTCANPDGKWHSENVQLGCTASDSGSGLADPAQASFGLATSVPDGTEAADASTTSATLCDQAGNCVTAGPVAGNQVDRKAPTVSVSVPAEGAHLALGQQVAALYSCSDDGSGDARCSGPADVDTSAPGDRAYTVDATDNVGNSSSATVHYTVVGPPTASITSPADGQAFNQGQPVSTTFGCLEARGGPGIASCADSTAASAPSGSLDTTKPGTFAYTVTATSRDGQIGSATIHYTVVGRPTAVISDPAEGQTYLLGQAVATTFSCSEASGGPGIASCIDTRGGSAPRGSLDTSRVGTFAYSVTATSRDDQTGTAMIHYTVSYWFTGFGAPIAGPPAVNSGKAGKTFPLKWQLADANGSYISSLSAIRSITYRATSCTAFTSEPSSALVAAAAGGTSLRYDSAAKEYLYNWATPGPGCYTLFITLDSGQLLSVHVNLT
jgi:hypothetical protein